MFRTTATLGATISLAALAIVLGDPAMPGSAAWARDAERVPTDVSAATVRSVTVVRPVARPVVRPVTVRPAVRVAPNVVRTNTNTRFRQTNTGTTRFQQTNVGTPRMKKTNFSGPTGPVQGNKLKVGPAVGSPQLSPKLGPKLGLGPAKIGPIGPRPNVPFIKLANNKVAPIFKGQKKIWWGGGWKTFLPYTALGVFVIGGAYYYPDGYLSVAGPYCGGTTPDGCRLRWQMVGFEDGGEDWQCVQYCPRPGAIPPPQAAAFTEAPPPAQGSCEVVIYPEPTFGGNGVPTGDEQPKLSESGWLNQIASIQVRSGTWDFFSGEEFTGESMRLAPGPYPTLGPDWTKRIGSFLCVQPGG